MVIGRKIIYGILAITFLFGAGSFLAVRVARRELEESIGVQSTALTRNLLNKVDAEIINRIREATLSLNNGKLREYLTLSDQEFNNIPDIDAHMETMEAVWLRTEREDTAPEISKVLDSGMSHIFRGIAASQQKLSGYSVYGEVFATNRYGAVVAMTGRTTDYRQDDEAWWRNARNNGLTIEPVTYDDSSGTYSTDIGIRIDDADGKFLGVVKIVLNIEGVIRVINETDAIIPYASSEIVLAEEDGRIIYSTTGKGRLLPGTTKSGISRLKGMNGYLIEGSGKEKIMITYARPRWSRNYDKRKWILMISYSAEELFAPSVMAGNIILICISMTIIVSLGLGVLISRKVAAPIDKLKQAALSITRGKLDTRVEVGSDDETGVLAGSLNILLEKIRNIQGKVDAYSKEVEERVMDRTAELRKAKDSLEEEVSERSRRLEDSHTAIMRMMWDLNQQAKALKEVHDKLLRSRRLAALGKLAAMVGHELKNPLGVMRNSIYVLKGRLEKSGHMDGKMGEHLEILDMEVDNSTRIINDILNFGGIKEPSAAVLDMCELIEGVLRKVDIPDNLEEVIDFGPGEHNIIADGHQLVQVFLNLIQNAVQAMPDGGKLTVSCQTDGQEEEIRIADTGVGIRPEDSTKVFEPFFSTKSSGTGLGLAVCQSIVENHGGHIRVESGEGGRGTVLIVTLPVPGRKQGKQGE